MKKINALFLIVFSAICPFPGAAQLSERQKLQTALVVKEAITSFQSSLNSLIARPKGEQDPIQYDESKNIMYTYVTSNCRLQNDILPSKIKGSPILDFSEFFKRATLDYPSGIFYQIDVRNAQFSDKIESTPQGYLLEVFAYKTISGTHKNGQQIQIDNAPCRIEVYVNTIGNNAKGCQIGYIDNDLSRKGKTFSLKGVNPLDFQTLDETLATLAKQLNTEIQKQGLKKVQITTFTYDNQEVIDDFSFKTTATFKNELIKLNPQLQITVPSRSLEDEPMVKGGYLVKGNFVEFTAQLYDEKKMALGTHALDKILHKNLAPSDEVVPVIAPPKALLEDAGEVNRIMENPNALPNATGLKLDIVTNRGINSLVYEENDTMRLAVRVNKPCIVRLIYRQADNKLVLLRNQDFQINDWQINQWIDIPEDFVCAEPYGAEFLIAYASTAPFGILKTYKKDGYVFIDNTLAETKALSTTLGRGVKNAGVSVVEQKLQITTRARKK